MSQVLQTAKNKLNPILPSGYYDIGHPPFVYLTSAVFYLLFGESPIISHIFVIVFSLIGIYGTYLIGKELVDEKTGILSSLLLIFSPIYFAQSGIFLLDMPLAALTILTLYFILKEDLIKYLISASILVLIKEPGVITIFSIILYTLIINRNLKKIELIKKILLLSIPLEIYVLWLFYHYFETGWFIYNWHIELPSILSLMSVIKWIFFDQFRFIITIFIIYTILIKNPWPIFNTKTSLLWLNIIGYTILFSSFSSFLPRYLLPVFPLLFIFGAISISCCFDKRFVVLIVLGIVFLFILSWFGTRNPHEGVLLESNLEYVDMVLSHKAALNYVAEKYPTNTSILADSPLYDDLTQTFLHYVDKPFTNVFIDINFNERDIDLVLFSYQSSNFNIFKKKIEEMNISLVKRFEVNGKITEIYEVKK